MASKIDKLIVNDGYMLTFKGGDFYHGTRVVSKAEVAQLNAVLDRRRTETHIEKYRNVDAD